MNNYKHELSDEEYSNHIAIIAKYLHVDISEISWDWLITVISKIERTGNYFRIENTDCTLCTSSGERIFFSFSGNKRTSVIICIVYALNKFNLL